MARRSHYAALTAVCAMTVVACSSPDPAQGYLDGLQQPDNPSFVVDFVRQNPDYAIEVGYRICDVERSQGEGMGAFWVLDTYGTFSIEPYFYGSAVAYLC